MKTLTDIVCALVDMMEGEEQTAYLATMAQGKRPTKPQRPMTAVEQWWQEKLNLKHDGVWLTEITPEALADDFIKRTGFTKSRHSAATMIGVMLKKLCPAVRRYDGKYLLPKIKPARQAFSDVFPMPRRAGPGTREASDETGIPANALNITMGERIS